LALVLPADTDVACVVKFTGSGPAEIGIVAAGGSD